MKLLIADDSQMVCARILTLLSDLQGVEVVGTTHSVADALDKVSQLQPDVILLDFRLSGNCNVDVLQLMKKSQPSLRVIVLTNYPLSHASYEKKCVCAGADFLVDKSLDLGRITEILDDFIHATQTL